MKKILYIAAAAFVAITASCASKTNEAQPAEENTPVEAAQPAAAPVAQNGTVIELTNADAVKPGTPVEQLTVIDFNAVWCGPCRQLTPVLEEMAQKYQGKVTFISVDVDKFGELFEAYNVGQSIPAVVFLSPDGSREDFVGIADLLPADKFEAIIEKKL
ncbi:MAG: thioredoxin family protein [Muribaculaceae bacterium]|nr:thioredoxin family protein [Muribaculaceae bacterium]